MTTWLQVQLSAGILAATAVAAFGAWSGTVACVLAGRLAWRMVRAASVRGMSRG